MTTLDKIKLIDFYLHGVDRKVSYQGDYGLKSYKTDYKEGGTTVRHSLYYHTSLDALRPVIVKLNQSDLKTELSRLHLTMSIYNYIYEGKDFTPVFESVVECIKYLNEKEK